MGNGDATDISVGKYFDVGMNLFRQKSNRIHFN